MDTSLINGYSEMTAEEKVKALEALEAPAPDYSGYVKKDLYDKTASQLSEANKKIRQGMTEAEQKALEQSEEVEKMRNRMAELEAREANATLKAEYIGLGFSDELAAQTAKAQLSGDQSTVFKNMKTFLENHDKAYKAELMKETPKVPNGTGEVGNGTADSYNAKAVEAQKNGNLQLAAYYLRLAQQAK